MVGARSCAVAALVAAVLLSGPSVPAASGPTGSQGKNVVDGSFDVGGHKLYIRCTGRGSPTVVHVHGFIENSRSSGGASTTAIQDIVDDKHRMCLYDRANVGKSDPVPGPFTGDTSLNDLHELLAAADIEPPYVLLAGSFGGLIADLYAATYPDEVVAMVQLDANLPREIEEIDNVFVPEPLRLTPDNWVGTTEQIDRLVVWAQARAAEDALPAIPLTYLAARPQFGVPEIDAAYAALQQAFVDRFSPGRLVRLDVPHHMEPVIPKRIAREVNRAITAARRS